MTTMNYHQQIKSIEEFFLKYPQKAEPARINSTQTVRNLQEYIDISLIRIHQSTPDSQEFKTIVRNLRYIAGQIIKQNPEAGRATKHSLSDLAKGLKHRKDE